MAINFDVLLCNETWSLVPYTSSINVVGFKWVFYLKYHVDSSLERHKDYLVAKGFNQQSGIDFNVTSSLVIKITTVQLFLSIAVSTHWTI